MKLLWNKQPHKPSTSVLSLYYSPLSFSPLFGFHRVSQHLFLAYDISNATRQAPETTVLRNLFWSNLNIILLSFLGFLFCLAFFPLPCRSCIYHCLLLLTFSLLLTLWIKVVIKLPFYSFGTTLSPYTEGSTFPANCRDYSRNQASPLLSFQTYWPLSMYWAYRRFLPSMSLQYWSLRIYKLLGKTEQLKLVKSVIVTVSKNWVPKCSTKSIWKIDSSALKPWPIYVPFAQWGLSTKAWRVW